MEVFEAMRTRASVRDFRPDPIGRGQMEKLKEAEKKLCRTEM